ncbi:hypothetical protein V1520DRAFT_394003 [Lipomyces starkeyi]
MSSSNSSLLGGQATVPRMKDGIVRCENLLNANIRKFHGSRASHILIIILVALDTLLVLAQLYIELFSCEQPNVYGFLRVSLSTIRGLSLAISTIFLIELISSIYAFGSHYFSGQGRWLRLLDAVVIISSFVFDLIEEGPFSEGAELIVVLRFWRIAKIAEEVSTETREELEKMRDDNRALRSRLVELESLLGIRPSDDPLLHEARDSNSEFV